MLFIPTSPVELSPEMSNCKGLNPGQEQARALGAFANMLNAGGHWHEVALGKVIKADQLEFRANQLVQPMPHPATIINGRDEFVYLPNNEGNPGDIITSDGQMHNFPGIRVGSGQAADCQVLVITQRGQTNPRDHFATLAIVNSTEHDPSNDLSDPSNLKVSFGSY